MPTTTSKTGQRGRPRARLSKTRISAPMVTQEAYAAFDEFAEHLGTSVPSLVAQIVESGKSGKKENLHRALAAFQDAIEK